MVSRTLRGWTIPLPLLAFVQGKCEEKPSVVWSLTRTPYLDNARCGSGYSALLSPPAPAFGRSYRSARFTASCQPS